MQIILEAAITFLENAKKCEEISAAATTEVSKAAAFVEARVWLAAAEYLLQQALKRV